MLDEIADNTTAVWDWAPPGTPVRSCLVIGSGFAPRPQQVGVIGRFVRRITVTERPERRVSRWKACKSLFYRQKSCVTIEAPTGWFR